MTPHKTTKNKRVCWCVEFRHAGKRYRVYGATRERAQGKAERKLRSLLVGMHEIKFTDEDRQAKIELGDNGTLLQAARFFLAHRHRGSKKTISDALKDCVAAKKQRNRRPAYLAHLEFIMGQLAALVGPDTNCDAITRKDVERFMEAGKWSAATRVGVRNRASAFFSYAVKQGWCKVNPVESIELESIEKKLPTIFTVEQVHRVLDTAQIFYPTFLRYLALGIFCGIRPEELQRLPLDAIKLEQSIVDIPASVSKTRDRRIVEISANCHAWLKVSRFEMLPYPSMRKHRRFTAALARVEWSADVMRHTFASYHIAHHQSADKTAHELGHHGSTTMLFRHYKATVTKEDAAAFWKIEPAIAIKVLTEKTGTED